MKFVELSEAPKSNYEGKGESNRTNKAENGEAESGGRSECTRKNHKWSFGALDVCGDGVGFSSLQQILSEQCLFVDGDAAVRPEVSFMVRSAMTQRCCNAV